MQRKCDAAVDVGGKAERCTTEASVKLGEKRTGEPAWYCLFHGIQRLVTRVEKLEQAVRAGHRGV